MTTAEQWREECRRIAREAVPGGAVSPVIQPGNEQWAEFGKQLVEIVLGSVERVAMTRIRQLERDIADLQRELNRRAAE